MKDLFSVVMKISVKYDTILNATPDLTSTVAKFKYNCMTFFLVLAKKKKIGQAGQKKVSNRLQAKIKAGLMMEDNMSRLD